MSRLLMHSYHRHKSQSQSLIFSSDFDRKTSRGRKRRVVVVDVVTGFEKEKENEGGAAFGATLGEKIRNPIEIRARAPPDVARLFYCLLSKGQSHESYTSKKKSFCPFGLAPQRSPFNFLPLVVLFLFSFGACEGLFSFGGR